MVLAIPFIVVVFPIASFIAILVSMGIYWGISQAIQDRAAFWLTLLISLIPFLAAPNAEHWAERFRGYRIARHLLRVLGVPWLAAQYFIYLPGLMGPTRHAANYPFFQFIGQILSRPGVLGTMLVLAVLAHWVGSSFDLSGNRPASWAEFTLSGKLKIATGLGFAIGVADTFVVKAYDSAAMVILRVGLGGGFLRHRRCAPHLHTKSAPRTLSVLRLSITRARPPWIIMPETFCTNVEAASHVSGERPTR